MALEIFRRREQKYLITKPQYKELIRQLQMYMRPDKYGQNGKYTVSSLYFDNAEQQIYFETKNKLKYRQKLRLRTYGVTSIGGDAFFEVKQKHDNVVNKRRLIMPLREAYRYLQEGDTADLNSYQSSNLQVLREIDYFMKYYQLEPKMIISYDRQAFHGMEDADLRVTFDLELRCRKEDLLLEQGAHGIYFIDSNLVVLEVKVNDSVPLWLTRILQSLECEQRSASKFCSSMELLEDCLHQQCGLLENTNWGGR
ncbi:polyphosphate polymerase domain-containing protein [Planococcus salinus]|uniref:Polyphosphate polymerase domain-containing protein n=1 Tax=Planococcus salinus TaxID=1848460 RepID=A0A3M8P4T1_9BACL|nr:polyphosphate polymerase domain-containing protein [Planococcus salinus]RNF38360.1 polyphosphate polymerase domain-containing protein [Planococcus salinus]